MSIKKILCVGYRTWALNIYKNILITKNCEFKIIDSFDNYNEEIIYDYNPDFILFYGWSWIINDEIINKYKCIMLHPSPLPKYRGGSPIQNQIINGELNSKVTLFLMNDKIDEGDIILQDNITLDGHLNDIFNQITKVGTKLTIDFLNDKYFLKKQNNNLATYCKRRLPSHSEITLEELQTKDSKY